MTKPLEGIRVVEIGTFVFGPATTAVLADWGAEVIKIEHPVGGDPSRGVAAWGVPASVDGVGFIYEFNNRSKRGLALDVSKPEGYDVLLQLIDTTDVFLTSFLPATRRKLRIEPADIQGRNPRVIYARATGQGVRGPDAEGPGFDAMTYWARAGASVGVTPPDFRYPLAMPGPGFGDVQSGMALAGGIGSALFFRERTGKGTVVDGSLLASGLWAMGLTIMGASLTGRDTLEHQGHDDVANPLVNNYRTSDGMFIALVFLQVDRYWPEFCLAVGKDEWLADERLLDLNARKANAEYCVGLLDELFSERTFEEWSEVLSQQEGQWDVVATPGRAMTDADAIANGYIQQIPTGAGSSYSLVTAPVQFDEEPASPVRAPRLGADTDAVLGELGIGAEALAALRDDGVIA